MTDKEGVAEMSKYNPRVGDRYIAECDAFKQLIFNFEVLAIVLEKEQKYFICHKVGGKVKFGAFRGLVVFDQDGQEVNPLETEYAYYLVRKSKGKSRWDVQ